MSKIDLIILVLAIWLFIAGFLRGLIREIFLIVVAIITLAAMYYFTKYNAVESQYQNIIPIIVGGLVYYIARGLLKPLMNLYHSKVKGFSNSILGGIFGLLKTGLYIVSACVITTFVVPDSIENSKILSITADKIEQNLVKKYDLQTKTKEQESKSIAKKLQISFLKASEKITLKINGTDKDLFQICAENMANQVKQQGNEVSVEEVKKQLKDSIINGEKTFSLLETAKSAVNEVKNRKQLQIQESTSAINDLIKQDTKIVKTETYEGNLNDSGN